MDHAEFMKQFRGYYSVQWWDHGELTDSRIVLQRKGYHHSRKIRKREQVKRLHAERALA